jgi:GR25 family glycosyltransferase involved in LPS biosynthesis
MIKQLFFPSLILFTAYSLLNADTYNTNKYFETIHLNNLAENDLQTMSSEELDANWKLNDFFGCIYVINLPSAKDRLEKMKESMAEVGIEEFEVFPAVNGRNLEKTLWKKMKKNWANHDLSTVEGKRAFELQRKGEAGCYLSHLHVLEKVKENYDLAISDLQVAQNNQNLDAIIEASTRVKKYSSVLVLEDDNGFGIVQADGMTAHLEGVGQLFREAMQQLPEDWKTLHFMALSFYPGKTISKHITQLAHGIVSNACAIHHSFYETLITQLRRIYDPQVKYIYPYDDELAELQKRYPCYAIYPSIAYQREGISSITGSHVGYLRQTQP